MTRHALAAALGVGLLASLAGCGTMANFDQPDAKDPDAPRPCRVFGGVARDSAWARKCFETPAGAGKKEPSLSDQIKGSYWLCVDWPCSLVADTITLPLTLLNAVAEEEDSLQMSPGRKTGWDGDLSPSSTGGPSASRE